MHDMIEKDRAVHTFGELNGCAKLDAEQVREIRRLAATGTSQYLIAAAFQITQSQVSRIASGKRWPHLK